MNTLSRVLAVFTLGLFGTGLVLGFQEVGQCGSVLNPDPGRCSNGELAGHVALVIAFFGLTVTCVVAAYVANLPHLRAERQRHLERQDDRQGAPGV